MQVLYTKKDIYLTHSFGVARAWHWHLFGSGKGLLIIPQLAEWHHGGSAYKRELSPQSKTGSLQEKSSSQTFSTIQPILMRTKPLYGASLNPF